MLIERNKNYYKDGTWITAAEYAAALEEIKAKAAGVDTICAGTTTIEDVPSEWREEIQRRVTERQSAADDPELTAEEALDIILGGEGV